MTLTWRRSVLRKSNKNNKEKRSWQTKFNPRNRFPKNCPPKIPNALEGGPVEQTTLPLRIKEGQNSKEFSSNLKRRRRNPRITMNNLLSKSPLTRKLIVGRRKRKKSQKPVAVQVWLRELLLNNC
jgi:hypothetical protein